MEDSAIDDYLREYCASLLRRRARCIKEGYTRSALEQCSLPIVDLRMYLPYFTPEGSG